MRRILDWLSIRTWKFWTLLVCGVVMVAALAVVVCYFVAINTKLTAPKNLSVYEVGNAIYLEVEKAKNAEKYEFVISRGTEFTQNFVSANNVVEVSQYINQKKAGEFEIKCRALGKTENAHSDFVTESYTRNVKISAPVINVDGDKLYFNTSDNFSETVELTFVLNYQISAEGNFTTYTTFHQNPSNNTGTVSGYFDLNFLPEGQYMLSVVAKSKNNVHFLDSNLSNIVVYFAK